MRRTTRAPSPITSVAVRLVALLLIVPFIPLACAPPAGQEADDPFLWLEEVEGERAME